LIYKVKKVKERIKTMGQLKMVASGEFLSVSKLQYLYIDSISTKRRMERLDWLVVVT